MKRGITLGTRRNPERIFMEKLKPGQVFYSSKKDKDLTAIASNCNKKIVTQRLIGIHPNTRSIEELTKVTLIT